MYFQYMRFGKTHFLNSYLMLKKSIYAASFVLLVLFPMLVHAQEAQKKKVNTLLPDINPQDIEIKGDFKATFPGLRRQPILGFNPTPPVFQVSGNQIPFMESPDEAVANLPISKLEKPIAPAKTKFAYPHFSSLYSHLGWGTDMSPEAGLFAESKTGKNGMVLGHFNFQSSNGHYNYQKDSYRNLGLDFEYIQKMGKDERLGLGLNGISDFNYRPGVDTAMNYGSVGFQIGFEKVKNPFHALKTHFNYNYFTYYPQGAANKAMEHQFNLKLNQSWEGAAMNSSFMVGVDGDASLIDNPSMTSKNWYIITPHVGYQWRSGFNHRFTVQLNGYFESDTTGSNIYLYPDLKYEYWGITNLKFTAEVSGKVFNRGLAGRYQQDRMLVRNMIPINERNLTAKAQASYELVKGLDLTGGFRFQKYYDYQYVNLDNGGQYVVNIDHDTQMWKGFAGLSYDFIPQRVAFSSSVYVQNQKLSTKQNVPFMEKMGVKAQIEINPVKSLNFKVWGNYLGNRTYGNGLRLKNTLLLGSKLEYDFTSNVGIYLKGTNLLNSKYVLWPNYTEMPFQLFGGITFRR